MPSTYTTNLSLEKQATGENQNTWGTNANSTLDNIDTAIVGVLTKSVAGAVDVTLTTDEGRNRTIIFTGVLTGNINVVFPAAMGLWSIKNSTTGAYTLSVKTASGGAFGIAQGYVITAYCDGTTFSSAAQTLVPSGGTFAVAGTETVNAGGSLVIAAGASETVQSGGSLVISAGATETINSGGTFAMNGSETLASGASMIWSSGALATFNSGATLAMNGLETHASGATSTWSAGGTETFNSGASLIVRGTLDASGGTLVGFTSGYSNGSMILASNGSVSAPGMAFNSDQDNGFYYIGANNWAAAAGGTKAVEFQSGATLLLPAQPMILATRITSSQTVSNATATKVQLNNLVYNVGGFFDATTNYQATNLPNGKYLCIGGVACGDTLTSGSYAAVAIKLNSTYITETMWTVPSGWVWNTIPVAAIVDVTSTSDTIQLWGVLAGSSTKFMAGGQLTSPGNTWLAIAKVA